MYIIVHICIHLYKYIYTYINTFVYAHMYDDVYVFNTSANIEIHMGGYQDCGPLLGPLNTRCRTILRTPKRGHDFDQPCFLELRFRIQELSGAKSRGPKGINVKILYILVYYNMV